VHKYALSRITTAVDTALRITCKSWDSVHSSCSLWL